MYRPPTRQQWQGRVDKADGEAGYRWHQVVQLLDLSQPGPVADRQEKAKVAMLGFCSDEGVRRNQGRVGAVKGPAAIRKALANLAVHFPEERLGRLYDAGDVLCTQGNLEGAQEQLAGKVQDLLANGFFPILLGGGHEIVYGHYAGLKRHLGEEGSTRLGLVNFDAHFDLRSFTNGATSGTPFRQILAETPAFQGNFPYLCLGIQQASNTRALFETADAHRVQYVYAEQVRIQDLESLSQRLQAFIQPLERLYVTVDLDVFAAAFAPGVSAPALSGIFPGIALHLLRELLASGKVLSLDVAELSPDLDQDSRTARLAASIIYQVVMSKLNLF
ncbi:formimidoylglutamase [soil metagenome]